MPTGDDRLFNLFLPLIVSPGRKRTLTLQVCTGIFSLLLRKATFSSLFLVKYLQCFVPSATGGDFSLSFRGSQEVSECRMEWGPTGTWVFLKCDQQTRGRLAWCRRSSNEGYVLQRIEWNCLRWLSLEAMGPGRKSLKADQERHNNGLDQGEDRGNVVTGWI